MNNTLELLALAVWLVHSMQLAFIAVKSGK
jgi:hypothetical protein